MIGILPEKFFEKVVPTRFRMSSEKKPKFGVKLLESTIGAFATDKINKTAKKLRDMRDKGNLTQNELRECKAIIDLLAPGVIKSKLIELYEETTAKRVDKKKSIMEQYIKELSSDELENLFDVLYEEKKRRDNDKN